MISVVPGIAMIISWFLAIIGKARDYKDNQSEEFSDFIAAD